MAIKKKILIVDDEPEIGRLLQLFLEDDFEVKVFSDPRIACDQFRKEYYDLIISDVKMPFITGFELLKIAKNECPSTLVILMTGHAQTAAETSEAVKLGAERVLFKPFGDPSRIVAYILDLLVNSPPKTTNTNGLNNGKPKSDEISGSVRPLIMAVDDEQDLIEVLGLLLEDKFDVRTFSDPTRAAAEVEKHKFKLILTDLNMPHMSGIEFISQIRAKKIDIPIIVMSGHGPAEIEVQMAMKAGANALLSKPFPEPEKVVEILGKLLNL